MSKYAAFGDFLRSQRGSHLPLTFKKIEEVIGDKLPPSSRYSAWWSNNPTNNVMTGIWLAAGFRSEQVDIPGRKIVFRRVADAGQASPSPASDDDAVKQRFHPLFGALKGLTRVAPGVDLTEPADPDWGKVYD
jgi:hypothetical protein